MLSQKITIVIVNWNVKTLLNRCLRSIFDAHANDNNLNVLVVDNNSSDGSQKMLLNFQKGHKNFEVIVNTKNNGFAKACNQGIKKGVGEYVLLLNPDTEIQKDTLQKMIDFAQKNNDAGVVGCKHLNTNYSIQPSVRSFPTLTSQILILLKLHHFLPFLKPLKKYLVKNFNYEKTQKVDQVAGSCFLITKKAMKKIGTLDENFFLWFEEVDYCRRVKNAGLEVYYIPDTRILHHGGQCFQQVMPLKNRERFYGSMLHYFKKHHGLWTVVILEIIKYPSFFLTYLQEKIVGNKRT